MFQDRTHRIQTKNAILQVLPTTVKEVVTWFGSFYSFPDVPSNAFLVQELMVSMLDKGTKKRDKFTIADELESRGAQLRFYSDGLRVGFFGRALKQDLPVVFEVLSEQLTQPLFDAEDLDKVRQQAIAGRQNALNNTRARAEEALNHALYTPDHPNYMVASEAEIAQLKTMNVDDLAAFHAAHIGANDFIMSVAGDIDPHVFRIIHQQYTESIPTHTATSSFETTGKAHAGRTEVALKDRTNLDVYWGQPLPITAGHPDYLPLYVGTYILGGNFSARLMNTVRDEKGLTYGISASLAGITKEYGGQWQVQVSLSQENLKTGIEATEAEIERFVLHGITEAELAEKKTTLSGKYKVELATTNGLARTLQQNAEDGFDPSWMDAYPEALEALTTEQVNTAIAQYLNPKDLHLAIAGTLPH